MTVKQLLTTKVSLPDRVVIIDPNRNKTCQYYLDRQEEKKDLERYYYKRNVNKWIIENITTPTTIREVIDQAESRYRNWKESMYIELKGDTKK